MSNIIDGKSLASSLKEKMKEEISSIRERYGRTPCLAVIIVGDNPASRSYVSGKIKACAQVGMDSRLIELKDNVTEGELLSVVEGLNSDDRVDGILVQLPLPDHIDEGKIIDSIAIEKDADGFHPGNVSALWLGRPCTVPCTPKGILAMIDSTGVGIEGKRAVVVGRSNIVGKPVAKLLLDRNATVTVCHSRTADLKSVCREADILVVAVGKPNIVTADMIKPGATVIDVGIRRMEDGKLTGDVDFEKASAVAGCISPVPGGVGPMTITMLLSNTLECFRKRNGGNGAL